VVRIAIAALTYPNIIFRSIAFHNSGEQTLYAGKSDESGKRGERWGGVPIAIFTCG